MEDIRPVKRIVAGKETSDGAGVKLTRVFAHRDTGDFDPFLMLDAFDSRDPADYVRGFPWHPHRGIETVTYLIRGRIEHGDSLGNSGVISDGECQWMTAGSGIIHQEMPKASERMLGVQLWLNLPAQHKMTAPAYHGITQSDIPVLPESSATIRVIGGEYAGTAGAFRGRFVDALFLDVEIEPGASWALETDAQATLFVYILQGAGIFGRGTPAGEKHALLFGEGGRFTARAGAEGIRLLLLCGRSLKEPVAWGGPIVMNTQEELRQAFRELEENTFIK